MSINPHEVSIFSKGAYQLYRLLIVLVLALVLMFVDSRFRVLDPIRSLVNDLLIPVYWLGGLPARFGDEVSDTFKSRAQLRDELDSLKAKMLVLERKAQKLASTTAELNRLRALLNASSIVDDGVLVTEIIGASPDPDNQYVIINKGERDGVYLGQAVLDSLGLFGQVIEVNGMTSRVMLISDARHAVPVQVNRNGVRAIAYGVGSYSYLELGNVPVTSDIQEGDLLVSSGLGGRFPQGYPVGRVKEVKHFAGRAFSEVKVIPQAQLNKSRLLLLVFKAKDHPQN